MHIDASTRGDVEKRKYKWLKVRILERYIVVYMQIYVYVAVSIARS